MAKPFRKLLDEMSPEQREGVEERAQQIREEMTLHELRKALDITQEQLAEALEKSQSSISKFERQSDLRISTLTRFLEAMGWKLRVIASHGDRQVELNQFGGPDQDEDPETAPA